MNTQEYFSPFRENSFSQRMPTIIADKLSISEALELSTLIQKHRGSPNIK